MASDRAVASHVASTYAVILAGGIGKRFWPLSRRRRPKQFLRLAGERSMVQATVDRIVPLVPMGRVLVVAAAEHEPLVREHLPDLPPDSILAEPMGRNTAAAVAWAAEHLLARDRDATMVVLAADHHILNPDVFRAAVARAASAANDHEALVLFGIRPDGPKTQYGYIIPETAPSGSGSPPVYRVARFHEKPPAQTASAYIADGRCFWNSGMFVWRADVLRRELSRHAPDVGAAAADVCRARSNDAAFSDAYERIPSISIDRALLEHSERRMVVDSGIERIDLGNWSTIGELWEPDASGNATSGSVHVLDTSGSVHHADGADLVTVGVDDLVVVVSGNAVLVCDRKRASEVGRLVELVKQQSPPEGDRNGWA